MQETRFCFIGIKINKENMTHTQKWLANFGMKLYTCAKGICFDDGSEYLLPFIFVCL